MRTTVVATLTGALLVLAVLGGFMALDRTTLHWYAESSERPVPTPPQAGSAFTERDVIQLAQPQVQAFVPFPQGTTWVTCVRASFRSGNRMWIVTCEYREYPADRFAETARTYLFDDRTGKLYALQDYTAPR